MTHEPRTVVSLRQSSTRISTDSVGAARASFARVGVSKALLAVVALSACTVAGPPPAWPRQQPSYPTLEAPSPAPWVGTAGPSSDSQPASYDGPSMNPAIPHAQIPGYNTRVVALRTTLGRAAVVLEMRTGARQEIRSSVCNDPSPVQRGCSVCELAGDTDALDSAVLDALVVAFDRYPASVLEATHIEKVALCTHIKYIDIDDPGAIGTVDLKERRQIVSREPVIGHPYDAFGETTTEDIVHHELFHLFEFERMRGLYNDDPEWRLYNPTAFEYGDTYKDARDRPTGFVDPYASTDEIEDKASVYQYMMAHPRELCAIEKSDPIVKKKVALIWERITGLTDDAYLKARATCN